jgi:hypothetical protein
MPAFARARFGVLTGAMHGWLPADVRIDFTTCRVDVEGAASSSGPALPQTRDPVISSCVSGIPIKAQAIFAERPGF